MECLKIELQKKNKTHCNDNKYKPIVYFNIINYYTNE